MLGAGLVVSYKGSGVINFAYGAMAMYGLFTFDTAMEPRPVLLPVGRLPADERSEPAGQDHALRQRHVADGRRLGARAPDGGRTRSRCPLPRVPTTAPRCAARQGGRVARTRALPPGRGAHQLRQFVSTAREHRSRRDDRELPRTRQALPGQQPVRHRVRRADGLDRLGGIPIHPLRPGYPCGRRQREGCGAAGLLAAEACRDQLGDRLGAGDARRDRRRPDRRHDHPRRAHGADRSGARRSADRRSQVDPHRGGRWARPRRRSDAARRAKGRVVRRQSRMDADGGAQLPAARGDHRGALRPGQEPPDPRCRRGEAPACRARAQAGVRARVRLGDRADPDGVRLRRLGWTHPVRQLDPDRVW